MDTLIKIKRTTSIVNADIANTQLEYGEPLYSNDDYFVVGNSSNDALSERKVVKFVDKAVADRTVYSDSTNPLQLKVYDDNSVAVQLGQAALRNITTNIATGQDDLVPVQAIRAQINNLQNQINTLSTTLNNLPALLTTLDPNNNSQPVSSKAISTYVNSVVQTSIQNYVPWTTDGSDKTKFYVDAANGLKYRAGNTWIIVPVAYS